MDGPRRERREARNLAPSTPQIMEPGEEMVALEGAAKQGLQVVDAILKHTYHQGWRFLVRWGEWDSVDATWEPPSSFVQPDGVINEVFVGYCMENGLNDPIRMAARQEMEVRQQAERTEAKQNRVWSDRGLVQNWRFGRGQHSGLTSHRR